MRFFSTLVACCGADEHNSSATLNSPASEENDGKSLVVGLVREKKLLGGGKVGGKSGRHPVQWRPSLCTISEDDVVKAERIQLYVKRSDKGIKNIKVSSPDFTPFGYKDRLKDPWDTVSHISTPFLL